MKSMSKILPLFLLLTGALLAELSCKKHEEAKQPVACFTASATTVTAATSVVFTSCAMEAHHSEWDFGDGASSTEENPSHAFNNPGSYIVKQVVLSEDMSKMDEATQTITVN
jgi:PKD repeat protein